MTTKENTADNSPPSQREIIIKKKVTSRDVDKWEVALLNFNIEPRSKPTDLFCKIEEKRKIRHDKVLRKLSHDLHDINLKTEKNIMLSSLEVKSCMQLYNEQLHEILESIDIPEVASYDNSVFLKYQTQAGYLKSQLQKMVDELHEDLNQFENERAANIEKLFHVYFEEIRKIGYLLPHDVQAFIETEVVKMNQLSLNNRRCYDDLKLTLTLLTIQMFKQFIEKMFCIKEKWFQLKLDELSKPQPTWKKRIGVQVLDTHFRFELKGQELPVEVTSDNYYNIVSGETWQRNVYDVLNIIENNARSIIEVYKKMLRASYSIFDSDFEDIKKEIEMIHKTEIEERVMKPLIIGGDFIDFGELQNTEVFWQEALLEIKPLMEDMMEFLFSVCTIWDKHTQRLNESKILILKAMEKEEEDFLVVYEELELKLNISLDNLRQEADKVKLEKTYNEIVDMLNTLKAKYESNYLRKIAVVEDFYKMTNLEANVLSAGLREFLHQSRNLESRVLIFNEEQNEELSDKNLVYKAINSCCQMVKTIGFWKEGVWRALKHLSKNAKKFLEPSADDWVERKVEVLAEQMSTQINLLEKRFERVRIEFYEKRLAEIERHRSLCEEHKKRVKQVFAKMKENLKDLTLKQMNELDELEKSLDVIGKNAQSENRAEVIHTSILMLTQRKEQLAATLKYVYDGFRVDAEAKINEMKHSIVNFMKSIKLFHEGGNYSVEEGKMYATQLEAFVKEINNDYKNIVKEATKEEIEVTKKGSNCFTPTLSQLSLLFEETTFYKQVREKICDLIIKINDHVTALLDDFSSFENLANCFFRAVKNTKVPLKDDDFWIPSFDLLYKNVYNLFYPSSTELQDADANENEEGGGSEAEVDRILKHMATQLPVIPVTQSEVRQAQLDPSSMFKDLKMDLFNTETPPTDNGSFMAIISNMLWKEMDAFQKLASNFYKKTEKRKIIREDLIPTSFDALRKGILFKFQHIFHRCEELWLRTILDFLPIFGYMKLITNLFFRRKLEEYRDLAFESLTIFKNDFMDCLRSMSSNSSNVFRELENKLLPLHGNPRNQNLLKELEDEVVQKTAILETQWSATIELHQNQLKCFRLDHTKKKNEINQIIFQFTRMRDRLFTTKLGTDLVDLLKEYINKGGFLKRRDFEEGKNLTEEKENSVCWRMLSDFELKIESDGLLSSDDYLKKLNDIIENKYSYVRQDKPPSYLSTEPELHLLLSPLDPEVFPLKALKPVIECVKKLKTFADTNANVHEEILFKWLTTWKFNVKKIRKLYTVKYPERPEEPAQLAPKG